MFYHPGSFATSCVFGEDWEKETAQCKNSVFGKYGKRERRIRKHKLHYARRSKWSVAYNASNCRYC